MIEAGFDFDCTIDQVLAALTTLPTPLRPFYFSHEEKISSNLDIIDDCKRFSEFLKKAKSGFFLLGSSVTYSLRVSQGKPLICECFIDVEIESVTQLLKHMAIPQLIFGFACDPGEREARNRVKVKLGENLIESWVGRNVHKYLPGFYWLTLLSSL
jgi:hypothetical protein